MDADWLTGGGNAGNKYVQLGHNAMCDQERAWKWKERSKWNQSSFTKKNKKRNKSKWSKSSKGQAIIIIIIIIINLRGQSGPSTEDDDQLGGERKRVDASASAVMNGRRRRRCHCLQSVWKLMDWLKVIGWLVTAGQPEKKWKVHPMQCVITINSQQGRQIDCN